MPDASDPSAEDVLQAAIGYVSKGIPILPVWPIRDGKCACGGACKSPGKHPIPKLAPNGLRDATTDEAVVRRWWTEYPGCNIAGRLGKGVGLVLDVDPRNGGEESLAAVKAEHGPFPPGPIADTGGGGFHKWFGHPGGTVPPSHGFRPGLDLQGDGSYVLLPPSNHISGRRYSWVVGLDAPLPFVLSWLLALAEPKTGRGLSPSITAGPGGKIPHGQHHAWLVSVAASLASKTAYGSEADLLAAVTGAATASLDDAADHEREIRDAVASAFRKFGSSKREAPSNIIRSVAEVRNTPEVPAGEVPTYPTTPEASSSSTQSAEGNGATQGPGLVTLPEEVRRKYIRDDGKVRPGEERRFLLRMAKVLRREGLDPKPIAEKLVLLGQTYLPPTLKDLPKVAEESAFWAATKFPATWSSQFTDDLFTEIVDKDGGPSRWKAERRAFVQMFREGDYFWLPVSRSTFAGTHRFELYHYMGGYYNGEALGYLNRRVEDAFRFWKPPTGGGELADTATRNFVEEVVHSVTRTSEFHGRPSDANPPGLLCLENGILDLNTLQLRSHTPSIVFTWRLPVAYDPDATCPRFERYLTEVMPDPVKRELLVDLLGYCLLGQNPFQLFFVLVGDGGNGKTTYLNVIEDLLGEEACASESFQTLASEKWAAASLDGKLVNLCDDLPYNRPLAATGLLKTLTGGGKARAERKYQAPYSFHWGGKLIAAANRWPETRDDTTAFWRRAAAIEFEQVFAAEDPRRDPYLREALQAEMPGILNLALRGLARVRARDRFDPTGVLANTKELLRARADPVRAFLLETRELGEDCWTETDSLYSDYLEWAEEEGMEKLSKDAFSKHVKITLPMSHHERQKGGGRKWGWRGVGKAKNGRPGPATFVHFGGQGHTGNLAAEGPSITIRQIVAGPGRPSPPIEKDPNPARSGQAFPQTFPEKDGGKVDPDGEMALGKISGKFVPEPSRTWPASMKHATEKTEPENEPKNVSQDSLQEVGPEGAKGLAWELRLRNSFRAEEAMEAGLKLGMDQGRVERILEGLKASGELRGPVDGVYHWSHVKGSAGPGPGPSGAA